MAVQLLPLSVEYCQAPCDAVAALAVMAMPAKVSLSASEKDVPKRLATVSPAGVVASSVIAASVGVPLATGASFTAATVVERLRVAAEISVALPLVETSTVEALAAGPPSKPAVKAGAAEVPVLLK